MRILLANPNTTQAVTDTIAAAGRIAASPGTEIVPATARFGARVIGTRSEAAIAEHACLDMLAREAPECDAVIIGASLDSALWAAREMLDVPVLGLTESALHVACLLGRLFGAVTTNPRGAAVLREQIALAGLEGRCSGIHAMATTPLDILAAPEAAAEAIAAAVARAVAQDGAEVVMLNGAVMAGMPARLAGRVEVPVVEGVACAVGLAEALVRLAAMAPRAGSLVAPRDRPSVGLDGALAARLAGR